MITDLIAQAQVSKPHYYSHDGHLHQKVMTVNGHPLPGCRCSQHLEAGLQLIREHQLMSDNCFLEIQQDAYNSFWEGSAPYLIGYLVAVVAASIILCKPACWHTSNL